MPSPTNPYPTLQPRPALRYSTASTQPDSLPPRRKPSSTSEPDTRRKIVDVFTVKSILSEPPDDSIWESYTNDLHHLLRMMRTGQRREARGELAVRVGQAYQEHIQQIVAPAADQH